MTEEQDAWEDAMLVFEDKDKIAPPPENAALFIGSSSFTKWSTMAEDFAEIPVINRGFGGSMIEDSTRHVERIVWPCKPSLVVLYAGSNDLKRGKTTTDVRDDFKAFADKVRAGLPDVTIAFISINPSIAWWHMRETVQEANRLITETIRGESNMAYIDSYDAFAGPDGMPQASMLEEDNAHLNSSGYVAWACVIKQPILDLYKTSLEKA